MNILDRERKKDKARMIAVLAFVLLSGGLILGRALQFQVIQDSRLVKLAKRQFQSRVLIRPRRGMIVDRHTEPLAISVEVQSLAANPRKVDLSKISMKKLSQYLGYSTKQTKKLFSKKRSFRWIKRHLSEAKIQKISDSGITKPNGQLREGFWLIRESKRVYPNSRVAGHVIGQSNIDLKGVDGLEYRYDKRLRGKVTSLEATRDGLRRPTFIDAGEAKHIEDGKNLKLTLDATLQFEVERVLDKWVQKTKSQSGSVLVMDAVSGEILVMANAPFFNPNHNRVKAKKRRNRVVTDGYEPGSTMKPVLVATALEHGSKIKDIVWGGMGRTKIQGRWISEAESKEKFGWMSYAKLIQVSSNVGSAHLALKLGQKKYLDKLKELGFGLKTGIDFPGEISGWLPREKKLPKITLANIGFGQGLLTTRLQMARIYASFLNGGWLVKPKLIIYNNQPENIEPERVWKPEVAKDILSALSLVTEKEGTGFAANLSGFKVAGKTGTAQTVDPKTRRYSSKNYIASFIGFPMGVDEKLVILTSLHSPKTSIYASKTAAPLFREVLQATANRLGMQAKPGLVQIEKDHILSSSAMRQLKSFVKNHASGSMNHKSAIELEEVNTKSLTRSWKMPSLVGLSPREVTRVLKGYNFDLKMKGFGLVTHQSPKPGKPIADGSVIRVKFTDKGLN